jgi:hypothetical protein
MIDYHDLFAWSFALQPKSLKAFSKKRFSFLPEKRLIDLFRMFLTRKGPIIKYYVTPKTLKRIEKMDLDTLDLRSLSFLKDQYYKECGFFFFDSKVHCLYTITGHSIILFVMQGEGGKKLSPANYSVASPFLSFEKQLSAARNISLNKSLIGTAVIPFSKSEITITINNDLFLAWFALVPYLKTDGDGWNFEGFDKDSKKRIFKILNYFTSTVKENLDYRTTLFKDKEELCLTQKKFVGAFSDNKEYRGLLHDYSYKSKIVKNCVNTIIFLKTAKVVDETFIPFDDNKEREYKKSDYGTKGVIKVDSFYNTNIDVIAPFMVRGHFRNQPKKVDGIWTREPIYIDTFMKSGYHRRATIEKQMEK